MVKSIWIFTVSFFAFMTEITCGSIGFIFPGTFFLCFYLVVSYSKVTGTIAGAITCIIIEVILGRDFTALPLLIPLILYAEFWRVSGDRRYLLPQSVSGMFIGLIYYLYCQLNQNLHLFFFYMLTDFSFISSTIFAVAVSALGLPLMLIICDLTSVKIGLNSFRSKSMEESSEVKYDY